MRVAVVAVVLQRYVDPPEAVRTVLFPAQIVVVPPIVIVGVGFTVTLIAAVPVHPPALVPVTV